MKPQKQLAATMLVIIALAGCKKGDNTPPRDYTALFTKTVWTGEYQQEGNDPPKPYGLEFTTDNTVILHDFYGDYAGSYTLTQNKITANFTSMPAKLSAIITDDNKLSGFENLGAQHFKILNAVINDVTEQVLDNTKWLNGNNESLLFIPGSQVTQFFVFNKYTRKAGTIRFFSGTPNFAVIMADGTMEWTKNEHAAPVKLTKKPA
jgi:hypothetical protein